MTSYTKLTKPANTSYTNLNSVGKEQYDQPTLSYDDSTTYYDGINDALYTKISKPSLGISDWQSNSNSWSASTTAWNAVGTSYIKIAKPV